MVPAAIGGAVEGFLHLRKGARPCLAVWNAGKGIKYLFCLGFRVQCKNDTVTVRRLAREQNAGRSQRVDATQCILSIANHV